MTDAAAGGAATGLPLPTLLSHVLVAFTIEVDNELERELISSGHRRSVVLVSLVMWSNFLQFVDADGTPVLEVSAAAGVPKTVHPSLAGMERWGYVTVLRDPADARPKPPRGDLIVRPTAAGLRAQEVWRPLAGVIEERWQERYGEDEIRRIRDALVAIIRQLDDALPEYLPVVTQAMWAGGHYEFPVPAGDHDATARPLSALLSQVLLAFALEYEAELDLSLAMSANVVRVIGEDGVRVRDLPRRSGVSKEAISMVTGFLAKNGYAVVEPESTTSKTKVVRLTAKGREAQDAHERVLGGVQHHWADRYGDDNVRNLRDALERLVGTPELEGSPLAAALAPHPGGWRASTPTPETLPHHPMVLHRGGWPDGS